MGQETKRDSRRGKVNRKRLVNTLAVTEGRAARHAVLWVLKSRRDTHRWMTERIRKSPRRAVSVTSRICAVSPGELRFPRNVKQLTAARSVQIQEALGSVMALDTLCT